jgi:hypothetical protein
MRIVVKRRATVAEFEEAYGFKVDRALMAGREKVASRAGQVENGRVIQPPVGKAMSPFAKTRRKP